MSEGKRRARSENKQLKLHRELVLFRQTIRIDPRVAASDIGLVCGPPERQPEGCSLLAADRRIEQVSLRVLQKRRDAGLPNQVPDLGEHVGLARDGERAASVEA